MSSMHPNPSALTTYLPTLLLALPLPTHNNNITNISFSFVLHYTLVYHRSYCSCSLQSFLHLSGTTHRRNALAHRTLLWPAFAFVFCVLQRRHLAWLLHGLIEFARPAEPCLCFSASFRIRHDCCTGPSGLVLSALSGLERVHCVCVGHLA